MKKILLTLGFSAVLFNTAIASAESAYVSLQKMFNNSNDAIVETDIDLASNTQSNQKCSFAMEKEQDKLFLANVLRFEMVIPGQPGNGPLFPGTPDTKANMFMVNRETSRANNLSAYEGIAREGVKNVADKEIHVLITTSNLQDSPIQLRLRKLQDYVTIEAIAYKGSTEQQTFYGYCYRQ